MSRPCLAGAQLEVWGPWGESARQRGWEPGREAPATLPMAQMGCRTVMPWERARCHSMKTGPGCCAGGHGGRVSLQGPRNHEKLVESMLLYRLALLRKCTQAISGGQAVSSAPSSGFCWRKLRGPLGTQMATSAAAGPPLALLPWDPRGPRQPLAHRGLTLLPPPGSWSLAHPSSWSHTS